MCWKKKKTHTKYYTRIRKYLKSLLSCLFCLQTASLWDYDLQDSLKNNEPRAPFLSSISGWDAVRCPQHTNRPQPRARRDLQAFRLSRIFKPWAIRKQTGSQGSLYRLCRCDGNDGVAKWTGRALSCSFRKLQLIGYLQAVGVGDGQGQEEWGPRISDASMLSDLPRSKPQSSWAVCVLVKLWLTWVF